MKQILQGLQEVSSAASKSDEARLKQALQSVRNAIQKAGGASDIQKKLLPELDAELKIWQQKLSVIIQEPVGRQGMAKHALHWVERLKI